MGPQPLKTDETRLLQACRTGDAQALDLFYRTHVDRVAGVLGRLVGPTPDLEDLVQATFAQALQSLTRFRGESSLSTWVIRIGVHLAAHHLRRGLRRPVALEVLSDHDELSDPRAPADRELDARRLAHRIDGLLDSLSPKRRIALLLYVVEGYSVDEVAALTGASRAATKSRIWFARRQLLKLARRDPVLRAIAPRREAG
ncbi:MAG: RNA polymerase sigma factor [Deltaproteobacteria bacterium]|nr:RNA polymerase sigma factor [Deltaproteobacteria bacterium]